MNRADSLQQRIDALKRKCSTGYGCGSACISLRKECRTRPGSAIGRERLKRLMALAAGSPSSQRGIGTVKAKEAGKLAGAITARRSEKASQLRGARQQAAAEKAQAAQAAEAAAKAAAQARHELSRIAANCHWNSGTWTELGLAWDDVQNVPKHISALSNFLARAYLAARKDRP